MSKYFTVKTISFSGLTDQLGTQFSRLYSLGCACQYEYVYTPFSFPRSHGYRFEERLIRKIEKFIVFTFPWFFRLRFTQKLISKIFSLLYKGLNLNNTLQSDRDEEIINSIGFNNFENKISDHKFNTHKVISVDIREIIETNGITQIYQLKHILDNITSSSSLIYEFVWNETMHQFIPELDSILKKSGLDNLDFTNRKLSENYWKGGKEKLFSPASFSNKKINLVAHIRLGDSVALHLTNKTLYVFGDCVFSTDLESDAESMKAIFDIDPTRKTVNIHQYEIILKRTFEILGRENIFCTILSDGYERTFNVIVSSILKGQLQLSSTEMRQLQSIGKALNNDLNAFIMNYSDTSIIGESFDKFLQSIHTLASAELVIWGTGGFAFNTHKLFKKHNHFTNIVHVTNHTNEVFQEIALLKSGFH